MLAFQIGMFTFTGLTRPQCEVLTARHHVYLTMVGAPGGRFEGLGVFLTLQVSVPSVIPSRGQLGLKKCSCGMQDDLPVIHDDHLSSQWCVRNVMAFLRLSFVKGSWIRGSTCFSSCPPRHSQLSQLGYVCA